ncbi:MAG: protein kinase [Phormidesmis sp.]
MSSLIGKTLQGGKYKLEVVLGRGGFGLTFRAHQLYLDQVVVIKTLHESYWRAPNLSDLQRQFQDEARRLAMCSHPNVVRVSDFFIEDGLPYMVMDYIPGRSLADIVLPSNPLPVRASIDYISQIGRALQAVHAKGLLHRDVKPQNIMIHQLTGEAVLIDFGIARELTQNPTQTHTSIVSEGYAPIEQYLPKAHRSAATDVYGLAATLYTLLTAEVPVAAVLRDRNPLTPIQQLRPDVNAIMADAIAQGMNIELKDRPQSVGRWLTMLTTKPSTGIFGRTGKTSGSSTDNPALANPSTMPTQVVAPGYRSAQPAAGSETNFRTVVAPIPTGYEAAGYEEAGYPPINSPVSPFKNQRKNSRKSAEAVPRKAPKKTLGCGSVLGLVTLAIAGAIFGAGFWLYQNVSKGLTDIPKPPSVPEISLPEIEPPAPPTEEAPELEPVLPPEPEATTPIDEAPATEDTDTAAPENLPPEPSANEEKPPLLLDDSGNPDNAKPGKTGDMVPVPGLPPGTSEGQVEERLGAPTQQSSTNGFNTSTYTLVPNRVTLGYVYDQGSNKVRQSEAAFSPATDRLVMRTALAGMLDGRSTRELEKGLEDVRKGKRDRIAINSDGFEGAIERNANGYVHIYVQQ